jgi:hypothetical protein
MQIKKQDKMKTRKNLFGNNSKQPEIKFEHGTNLSISGNSISLSPEESFSPLIDWITKYKGDALNIIVNIDIINCRSVKLLQKAILAADANKNIKKKDITWYFKDTEDKELGDMIASNVKSTKFKLFGLN